MSGASSPEALELALRGLRPGRIEAHLRLLAHPLLEGRGAGSRGGRLAEEYIRAIFAGAGLQPLPGVGYRQEVPMFGMDPRPELLFSGGTLANRAPRYREDYVLMAGKPIEHIHVDAELIFAGYGIHAPEFGWDDYEGVDVAGKVLLIRVNDPGTADHPDFFEGSALTYYGRWTYKYEEAARRGAAGVLLIHTQASAGYGWNVVRSSNTGEQFQLSGSPRFPLDVRGWLTEEVTRALLSTTGGDLDDWFSDSQRPGFRARPTGLTVRSSVHSTIREVSTANVLALLPGSDPDRSQEPVILMAHHDHLGMAAGDNGEELIYAGAYDNASGVALLLAMAQACAESGARFPRPLLFLASTAEESGLLGSEWYTRHPAFPLSRTAAVLNMDGVNLQGPTEDIAPLGVPRSTLGEHVREAVDAENLELTPELHPEQGMFFRQDHFPFARAGVPGIAFDHGLRYREKPEGWGQKWYEEFVTRHYHQPTDEFSEDFDYRGALQQGRVILRTAASVAGANQLPDWLPTSSFRRP